jgi:hypothetical protein
MREILGLRTAYRLTLTLDGPARPDSYSFGEGGLKAMRPNEKRLYDASILAAWRETGKGDRPFIPR